VTVPLSKVQSLSSPGASTTGTSATGS
jgi:hypothetical protein